MSGEYITGASITPEKALAGDSVEYSIKITLGKDFSANGSRMVLDVPGYMGCSRPYLHHQEGNGYTDIFVSNPDIKYTRRRWSVETGDFCEPGKSKPTDTAMAERFFVIDFCGGEAQAGDEIEIRFGYVQDGFGIGAKVTSLAPLPDFMINFDVRYFLDAEEALPDFGRDFKGYSRPIPDAEERLGVRVVAREPEKVRVIRQAKKASVLVLDRFYNSCPQADANEFVSISETVSKNANGVSECANPAVEVTAKRNDIELFDAPQMTDVFDGMNIYFGDMHTHSSTSNDCIEREKQELAPCSQFAYARDISRLDFLAVTDHHQPWDIERNKIGEKNWKKLLSAIDEYNCDGDFLAMSGFEFRCIRGDSAIVFNERVGYDTIDNPQMSDVRKLWENFKGLDYLSIPHFHNPGNLADGEWYDCGDMNIEPVLEIYSCHASYERDDVQERQIAEIKRFRPDRNGRYFLDNGYKYGFVANSDGHKGNPGANGLTAVYSKELTGKAIFDAIRKRQVYATSNARIRLLFTINNHLMGSEVANEERKILRVSACGERPFKMVDIFRNGELFKRIRPDSGAVEIEMDCQTPQTSNWYVRATQIDNHIAWSSPIWFI